MQPNNENQPPAGGATPPADSSNTPFQQPTVIAPQAPVAAQPAPLTPAQMTPSTPNQSESTVPTPDTSPATEPAQQPFVQPVGAPNLQPNQTQEVAGMPIPTMPQPLSTPTVVSGSFDSMGQGIEPVFPLTPAKKSKKKWILGGGVLAAVLLLSSGFVFGYYIPNTPANVWKTGMHHTGQAVESLLTDSTSGDNAKNLSKIELSGAFSYGSNNKTQNVSGSFNSKTDGTDSNSSGTVRYNLDGTGTKTVSGKLVTIQTDTSTLPDIFFQISGLSSLGLDAYVPNIKSYENRWIEIDGSYLESLGGGSTASNDSSSKQLTTADAHELAVAVGSVSREYLFGTDSSKAVLVNKSFVGKETTEGVKTYHYTVAVDKTNFQAFCAALGDKVSQTNAYKKLVGSSDTTEAKKGLVESCKGTDTTGTFDVWIDSGYKLIHKVRFTDDKNTKNYVEFGQSYAGGDTIPFFLKAYDAESKSTGTLALTVNTKTNQIDGKGTLKIDGSDGGSGTLTLQLKPITGDFKVERPTNTIKIEEILSQFGF